MTQLDQWRDNTPANAIEPGWRRTVAAIGLTFALIAGVLPLVAGGLILPWPIGIVGVVFFAFLALAGPILVESGMPREISFGKDELVWRTRRVKIRRASYDQIEKVFPSPWKGDWKGGQCSRYIVRFRSRIGLQRIIWLNPTNKAVLEESWPGARG